MSWSITVEQEGKNPGPIDKMKALTTSNAGNMGGLVIYLTDGTTKEEFTRVAYVRRVSNNPTVKFQDQLAEELEKAKIAAEALNKHAAEELEKKKAKKPKKGELQ